MKILFRFICFFSLIFCSGCLAFPYHFTLRPGGQGTVVDGQTSLPIKNAQVDLYGIYGIWNPTNRLSSWHTNLLASTESANDGTFKIPPVKEWGLLIIPGDYFPRDYELKIEGTNYQTAKVRFDSNGLNNGLLVKTIRLSHE